MDQWPCVLQRTSPVKEHATLVAGAVPILRFLYASEACDYEWYNQSPLDRAKLDQFLEWYSNHRCQSSGFLPLQSLQTIEDFFLGETQPYLCGSHDASICDLIAFFAIIPKHKLWIKTCKLSKLKKWADKMEQIDEVAASFGELQLKDPQIKLQAKL